MSAAAHGTRTCTRTHAHTTQTAIHTYYILFVLAPFIIALRDRTASAGHLKRDTSISKWNCPVRCVCERERGQRPAQWSLVRGRDRLAAVPFRYSLSMSVCVCWLGAMQEEYTDTDSDVRVSLS